MAKQTTQEKCLLALLESPSIREAAKTSGIGEATFYRYLKDKDFLTQFREARRLIVETSITQLQQASGEAVETLKKNLTCGNPAAENQAARLILDNTYRGMEALDILPRLEVLEDEFEKQNQENGKSNNKRRW